MDLFLEDDLTKGVLSIFSDKNEEINVKSNYSFPSVTSHGTLYLTPQDVDMIIAPMGITEAREGVIDFTSPFFYDDSAAI